MGDALQSVLNGVGEIVHGVDAPLVPLPVMVHMADAVDHRVAHVEVAGGQVDFGPEGILVVLELPGPHPGEQVEALLNGPIPVGGHGGGVQVAPVLLELLGGQLTDVGQPLFDQLHGKLVVLLKVVGAVEEPVAPVEAQPVDILLNGLHELHILLGGVGVVHAQVAQAVILLRSAKIDAQSLTVADVQIAIWFRRKPGVYRLTRVLTAFRDILIDKGMDKIFAFRHFSHIQTSSHIIPMLNHYTPLRENLQHSFVPETAVCRGAVVWKLYIAGKNMKNQKTN